MAEEYTQEQLEGMNRLHLRRIVKKMGMSADDAGDLKAAELISWILEEQGGGGGSKKSSKKSSSKKASTKSKAAPKGRRSPPKRQKDTEPEDTEPEDTGEVEGDLAEVMNAVADTGQKVDELGGVYNENHSALMEEIGELRVENYCIKGLLMKLMEELKEEEVIKCDAEEVLEELEKECEGNE